MLHLFANYLTNGLDLLLGAREPAAFLLGPGELAALDFHLEEARTNRRRYAHDLDLALLELSLYQSLHLPKLRTKPSGTTFECKTKLARN